MTLHFNENIHAYLEFSLIFLKSVLYDRAIENRDTSFISIPDPLVRI